MNNYEYQDDIYYDAQESGSGLVTPTLSSLAASHSNSRAISKMQRRVENVALAEHAKAHITKDVIVNTTALSAFADVAVQAVPSCERDVRGIVSTYAASSAQKIAETRWW
jgi:hypothetical protein